MFFDHKAIKLEISNKMLMRRYAYILKLSSTILNNLRSRNQNGSYKIF